MPEANVHTHTEHAGSSTGALLRSHAPAEKRQVGQLPSWITQPSEYDPPKDKDAFVAKSILSVTSVLSHFRLDDGKAARFSASAPMKLIFGFGCILLTSLSSNFFFTLIMFAGVLVRLCLLPSKKLKRAVGIAVAAAFMSFLLMVPAILLGQNHSAVLIATKVFVSVSIAMCVTLSTPFNQLTAGLRVFHVPNMLIMTIDLALKNIVSLGQVALEVLTALKLRSVGRNRTKGSSLGGVAGVVFLKANDAAQDTYDAMTCRGFEGEYLPPNGRPWKALDIAWALLLAALIVLFVYLQGAM